MNGRTIFQKSYTRDTTLIIQQLWFRTLTGGIDARLGIKHSFSPFGINYINSGAIEIWENVEAKNFIKEKLIDKSISDTKFLKDFLLSYEQGLKNFERVWEKNNLTSLEVILNFVNKVDGAMCADLALCYLAGQDRAESEIKNLAERLRATDHFFASNDFVIREGLKRVFPKLGDYVICIKIEELYGAVPNLAECKKRFKNFVVASDGYFGVESWVEYTSKHSSFVFVEEKGDSTPTEIKGRVGIKGKVKGTVKIIRLIRDIGKIEAGDIVVSPMTTPAFMPALIKAAAFITDEGGILCHAVVVAREMKKPCIISTKIATKILKDGDFVEVDASGGVVKILKRAGDK